VLQRNRNGSLILLQLLLIKPKNLFCRGWREKVRGCEEVESPEREKMGGRLRNF
jgi:hypothetical protein